MGLLALFALEDVCEVGVEHQQIGIILHYVVHEHVFLAVEA